MQSSRKVWLVLVLVGSVLCKEELGHGPRAPRDDAQGEHNAQYDHQAVLGSEDAAEEFDDLPPEEARERLAVMVTQHDLDGDGQISKTEMYKWITNSFLNLDREEGMEKFEEEDEDKDGQVTWPEYLNKVFGFNQEDLDDLQKTVKDSTEMSDEVKEAENTIKMVEEDKRFFKQADENGDGSLNPDEYMAFFFPHNYPHMHSLELERYLQQNDADGDGKISLKEFSPEGASAETRITSEENFKDFDKDGDGLLTPEEVKEWVVPGTDELAEDEVKHLFTMADADGNDYLSMDEILEKTDEFVGSSATDYGNFLRHDEL